MVRPRDYDAELRQLQERQRALKAKRIRQLGELVAATRADALDRDILAGALLAIGAEQDKSVREGWRVGGAAFFRERGRSSRRGAQGKRKGDPAIGAGAQPAGGVSGSD